MCELALIKVRFLPSHRDWETGALTSCCWPEQMVNSFGSFDFSQASTLRGVGIHSSDATRKFISVYSSLYWPKLAWYRRGLRGTRLEFDQGESHCQYI